MVFDNSVDWKIRRYQRDMVNLRRNYHVNKKLKEKDHQENALQKKFQYHKLKEIIKEAIVHITNKIVLDEISGEKYDESDEKRFRIIFVEQLNCSESNISTNLLRLVKVRVNQIIRVHDLIAENKNKKGEKSRLINPKNENYDARIEYLFKQIIAEMIKDGTLEKVNVFNNEEQCTDNEICR